MSRPRMPHALLCGLLGLVMVTFGVATTRGAVGSFTPADVNAAVAKGVAYIDSTQNADGSFGASVPVAETAFAIISYGVLDKGDFNNLPAAQQTHLRDAVTYLLSQQNADGSFDVFYRTYSTGLALDALQASTGIVTGIPAAISAGRTYLISTQNAPPAVTGNPNSPACSSDDQPPAGSGSDTYCGGWNYDADFGRSDESNTGFALTGLAITGGVPAATAAINVGWQRHVQELTATNYFAGRNDGGGDYEPGISSGDFSSNANDTGSLLFGYGYDGVAGSDPKVQAALTFGTDVLDVYELTKSTRVMVFHSGMNEDGACDPASIGCDWAFAFGEGGYHYSLWSLTKGFGHYIAPELSNPSNWYAKVVDLLLTEQSSDGSWPVDGRDDASLIVATSFAVDALGLVGVPTHTLAVTKSGSGTGTVTSSPTGIDCGVTCSAAFSQGTMVTLTASAAAGSTFTGWSGACTGTGSCTVTMDQDRSVTATFDTILPPAHLTLAKSVDNTGGGTALATAWTLSATGPTTISGHTGDATITNAAVNPGTYTLAESGGPTGYTAGTWSCTGGTLTGSSLVLAAGATASCSITNTFIAPSHQLGLIAPTDTTCQQYVAGTAPTLAGINYSIVGGKIGQNINPGVFFYFSTVTVNAGDVVTTSQSTTSSSGKLFLLNQGHAFVFDANCNKIGNMASTNGGATGSFTFTTAGTYILQLQYQTKSLAGTAAPSPANPTYTFDTAINGVEVVPDTTSISLVMK